MSSNKIDTSNYRPGMLWKRSPMATIVCTMVEGALVIKAINPRMLALLGLEQPLAAGLLAEEVLPTFVATPARLVEFEKLATGGPETPCLDFEVVHPEGDEIHTAYQVFAYGGDPGTVAIQLYDITARKRNDERLLRQRDTQQDILDLLPQAVYWLDKNGAYAGGNQALCKILGVTRVEELLGKQVQEVGGVLLDLQASRSGDRSLPSDTEGEFVSPVDSVTRAVLMRTIALHGRDGVACGELGILNDISALKQVERELVAHKETLERAVSERTRDLEQKIEMIAAQRHTIRKLATPVIQIWDGVLVLPIVGIVDPLRGEEILQEVLDTIVSTQSKCVILDVTATEIADATIAHYLLRVASGAGLLGARCVICGIHPATAVTFVEMQAELSSLITQRDLKAALHDCINYLATHDRPRAHPKN